MSDWTKGTPALVFQHCRACDAIWYFARGFCPVCGAPGPEHRQSSGRGRVYAMTHAAPGVGIDDPVQTRFVSFGTLTIPLCELQEIGA